MSSYAETKQQNKRTYNAEMPQIRKYHKEKYVYFDPSF